MKAELSGAGSAAVGAMEQQADIFLLSRGTWDSECDLLLHIFAMLPNMADWAACAMVCRMWRRLIPLARPYSLEERGINTRHTAWLERNSAMLSRLHTCSFGDMEGSVRDMHRHMCLVFENAPQIKRVIFGVSIILSFQLAPASLLKVNGPFMLAGYRLAHGQLPFCLQEPVSIHPFHVRRQPATPGLVSNAPAGTADPLLS